MRIGISAFRDNYIRELIINHSKKGVCEITGKTEYVYDTKADSYVATEFGFVLDSVILSNNKAGRKIADYFVKWGIIDERLDANIIVREICHERYAYMPELFSQNVVISELAGRNRRDYYEAHSIMKNATWREFSNHIKQKNRFFPQFFNDAEFKRLFYNCQETIIKGMILYRARICDEEHYEKLYTTQEMGAPSYLFASAGRMNSQWEPCLYLCEKKKTTIHEVKARLYDNVCIADFEAKKELNIVNISMLNNISPFTMGDMDLAWYEINYINIRDMVNDITKPLRRFDKELDYIPSQYICDFIRLLEFDGIEFSSTLDKQGINYAIFDPKNFHCKKIVMKKIVSMNFEDIELKTSN